MGIRTLFLPSVHPVSLPAGQSPTSKKTAVILLNTHKLTQRSLIALKFQTLNPEKNDSEVIRKALGTVIILGL